MVGSVAAAAIFGDAARFRCFLVSYRYQLFSRVNCELWLPENAAVRCKKRTGAPAAPPSTTPRRRRDAGIHCLVGLGASGVKMRYLEILASYVPQVVVRHLLDSPGAPTPSRNTPRRCASSATCGLHALTERLAENGEGAEGLKKTLNSYFGQLNRIVAGHGGDIFKFAGDAVMVLWPADEPLQPIARARRGALWKCRPPCILIVKIV